MLADKAAAETHGMGWMTPDPLGGDITNPQSLNRPEYIGIFDYTYALNNPTTLIDPLGLQPGDDGFEDTGDPCSDPFYAISNAECGSPGGFDTGFGFPFPPPLPPPVLVFASGIGSAEVATARDLGDSFIHNPLPCLTTTQQGILTSFLLDAAATLLRVPRSQIKAARVYTNGGGALTVQLEPPPRGLPENPAATANVGRSNRLFEHGYPFEIRPDAVVPVGPATSVHLVFGQGSDNLGRPVISQARIHADIGNPDTGGLKTHIVSDGIAATIFSGVRGCPVKFD